jgi:hypothetical protein
MLPLSLLDLAPGVRGVCTVLRYAAKIGSSAEETSRPAAKLDYSASVAFARSPFGRR